MNGLGTTYEERYRPNPLSCITCSECPITFDLECTVRDACTHEQTDDPATVDPSGEVGSECEWAYFGSVGSGEGRATSEASIKH